MRQLLREAKRFFHWHDPCYSFPAPLFALQSFNRYLNHHRDFNQLLLSLLRQLLREAIRLRELGWRPPRPRGGARADRENVVEIMVEDLELKVSYLIASGVLICLECIFLIRHVGDW